MSNVTVTVSGKVQAPTAVVYNILADYNQHRQILPPNYFTRLDIEEGGVGEGTRLTTAMNVMGNKQEFHLSVSEPQPGVLVESDVNTGMKTTFTVKPAGASESEVSIQTTWQPQPGLSGMLERYTRPAFMRRIYQQELNILDSYARQQNEKRQAEE